MFENLKMKNVTALRNQLNEIEEKRVSPRLDGAILISKRILLSIAS